jgi:hypothetical protein
LGKGRGLAARDATNGLTEDELACGERRSIKSSLRKAPVGVGCTLVEDAVVPDACACDKGKVFANPVPFGSGSAVFGGARAAGANVDGSAGLLVLADGADDFGSAGGACENDPSLAAIALTDTRLGAVKFAAEVTVFTTGSMLVV